MAKKNVWTKDQIARLISEDDFGYQNIDLPYGLATGGVDRTGTAKAIFPSDMHGKSVFDLGCRFGYFCFSAEERGSNEILGVDVDPNFIRKSILLAEIRGSAAKFQQLDIEKGNIDRQYDYVLCLNVLHHLRNPILAIEKLVAATHEVLVLELAGFSFRDRRQHGLMFPIAAILNRLPVFMVARGSSKTYFITTSAIRVMLLEKRADFARVDVVSAGPKGRPILLAHRRRIRRLFVVAGLPASGKSTLIKKLVSGAVPSVIEQVGFDQLQNWTQLPFGDLSSYTDPDLGDVIAHYNITKHLVDGDLYLHGNALADMIGIADEVTIITVACPRERQLAQFTDNRVRKPFRFLRGRRTRKKMKRIVELCRSEAALLELYRDWFNFVKSTAKPSFVVTYNDGDYIVKEPPRNPRDISKLIN